MGDQITSNQVRFDLRCIDWACKHIIQDYVPKPKINPSALIAFCPCAELGEEPRATDCHRSYRPDLLITSATDVPQSAPSPSPPGLPRWCVGLFPWAEGGGMRGGGVGGVLWNEGVVPFGGTGLVGMLWFAVVDAGWLCWGGFGTLAPVR
ncbi:MAG: hypothetical protein GY832_29535 [Chloroflexi bacterium]|nr:hypothetical protein [Chloroflexota bacterium]